MDLLVPEEGFLNGCLGQKPCTFSAGWFYLRSTLSDVGELADQMMASPDGRSLVYVPDTPDVIASTPILNPGESYELVSTVPDEPGEYQFVFTIPGHWRIMNGVFVVDPR